MGKTRTRDVYKEALKARRRQDLASNPNTAYGLAVALRSRAPGKRGGYLNALNRLQKKTRAQLKGVPGCGMKVKDWMTGYE